MLLDLCLTSRSLPKPVTWPSSTTAHPTMSASQLDLLKIQPILIILAIMPWKVIAGAELVNGKPLLLGKYRVRYLGASGHNIFTSWPIHNLVLTVCICLKVPYLIDTTESSTGNSGPSALQLTPTKSLSNSCSFSLRHFLVFLPNSRQHWSTGLGGHFQQQRHQQKTHKCEKRGTK